MKKILFIFSILLIFSGSVFSQFGTVDSVGLYPFKRLYGHDFTSNITGVTGFNAGSVSHDATNGYLNIISTSADKGAEFTSFSSISGKNYMISVNVADIGSGARVMSQWGGPTQQLKNGGNFFFFTGPASPGAFGREIIIALSAADTVRVKELEIYEVNLNPFFFSSLSPISIGPGVSNTGLNSIAIGTNLGSGNTNSIAIGNTATAGQNAIGIGVSTNAPNTDGIAIGNGAAASTGVSGIAIGKNASSLVNQGVAIGEGAITNTGTGVAIGLNAEAILNTTYGAAGGPENTAVGETAKAWGWRATAIGGNSLAGTTSATAIGAGAMALGSHAVALGRGAYSPEASKGITAPIVIGGDLAHDMYIANTWGHKYDAIPPSGISISSYPNPSENEVRIHGHDAFDASSTPSDFNVNGGDIALVAGLATGTGESGSINFKIGFGNGQGNVKDGTRIAAEIRSEEGITAGKTYLWLYDPATSTMKQVLIKQKNAAAGTNGIVSYQRLSF